MKNSSDHTEEEHQEAWNMDYTEQGYVTGPLRRLSLQVKVLLPNMDSL